MVWTTIAHPVGTAHPGCLDSIIYCLALAGRPVLGQQAQRFLDPDLGQVLGEGDAEVAPAGRHAFRVGLLA